MLITPEQRALPPQFDYDRFELPENVNLNFMLNAHNSPADLPPQGKLSQEIKAADAIILEFISDRDAAIALTKISKGDFKEYQRWREYLGGQPGLYSNWAAAFFNGLYATRTPVTSIDLPHVVHPALAKYNDASSRRTQALNKAKTNEDILATKPVLLEAYAGVKERDQVILENLKPRFEALCAAWPRLKDKRQRDAADVTIFYGSIHRSLLDAVVHKNTLHPADGFSVSMDDRSYTRFEKEPAYALFLRGEPVPDELILVESIRIYLGSALFKSKLFKHELPMSKIDEVIDELVAQFDIGYDVPKALEVAEEISQINITRT